MSVLQSWVEKLPLRMQSTLILGLRGTDTHSCPNIKIIQRWLRGLAFKPGNPDNVREWMYDHQSQGLPERIVEKGPVAKELEFCSQHFYSHLMHALEVVGYMHPDFTGSGHQAFTLYQDMCFLMHLTPEIHNDFKERLKQRSWPKGIQPETGEEAIRLLDEAGTQISEGTDE